MRIPDGARHISDLYTLPRSKTSEPFKIQFEAKYVISEWEVGIKWMPQLPREIAEFQFCIDTWNLYAGWLNGTEQK